MTQHESQWNYADVSGGVWFAFQHMTGRWQQLSTRRVMQVIVLCSVTEFLKPRDVSFPRGYDIIFRLYGPQQTSTYILDQITNGSSFKCSHLIACNCINGVFIVGDRETGEVFTVFLIQQLIHIQRSLL